jgi:hypothetical protein
MKKLVLVFASLFLICSTTVKSQDKTVWQNYVKAQFVKPIGEYNDYYNAGVGFEYGRMFPLHFDIANGLIKPGINVTFIQTTLNTGKDYIYFSTGGNDYKTKGGFLWDFDVKLGPMASIELTDGLMADFTIQYVPTLIFANREGPESETMPTNYKSSSAVAFANRVSMKAGIRYSHFIFGLECIFGSKELDYGDNIIPYHDMAGQIQLTDKKDLGLNTFLLGVGYSF